MASFLSHVVNKRKNKTRKYILLLPNVSEKMIAYHQRILEHCVTKRSSLSTKGVNTKFEVTFGGN